MTATPQPVPISDLLAEAKQFKLSVQISKNGPLYTYDMQCDYKDVFVNAARVVGKQLKDCNWAEMHASLSDGRVAVVYGDPSKPMPPCSYIVRNKGVHSFPKSNTTAVTKTELAVVKPPSMYELGMIEVKTQKFERSVIE